MNHQCSPPGFKNVAKDSASKTLCDRGRTPEPVSISSRSESSESTGSLLSLPDVHEMQSLEDVELTKRLNRRLWHMQSSLGDSFPRNVIRRIPRPTGCSNSAVDRYFLHGEDAETADSSGSSEQAVVTGKRKRSDSPSSEVKEDTIGGDRRKGRETQSPKSSATKTPDAADEACLTSLRELMDVSATADSRILCAFCGKLDCPHVARSFRGSCKEMRCGLCSKRGHPTGKCYQNYSEWESYYLRISEEAYVYGLANDDQVWVPPKVRCLKCGVSEGPICVSCVRFSTPPDIDSRRSDTRFKMVPYDPNIPLQPSFADHGPYMRGLGPQRYCKAFATMARPTHWRECYASMESSSRGVSGRASAPPSMCVSAPNEMAMTMGGQHPRQHPPLLNPNFGPGPPRLPMPTTASPHAFYTTPPNQMHPMVVSAATNQYYYGYMPVGINGNPYPHGNPDLYFQPNGSGPYI